MQARTVQCLVRGKPSAGCALHLKPPMSQACNTNFCPQPEKKGTGTSNVVLMSMESMDHKNYFLKLSFRVEKLNSVALISQSVKFFDIIINIMTLTFYLLIISQ